MIFIKKIFHRRKERGVAQSLRIEGVGPAPMTADPTDSERAAEALLESLAKPRRSAKRQRNDELRMANDDRAAADYHLLAHRIREGHEMEERACKRWLAYCEQELRTHPLNPPVMKGGAGAVNTIGARPSPSTGEREEGLLHALQRGLYDRQDIAEREGGELLRRWQHCLADVTVRLMNIESAADAAEIDQIETN